ncbi:MAG: S8 family serine peptidase [Candidatus Latescibacterota bacterium]
MEPRRKPHRYWLLPLLLLLSSQTMAISSEAPFYTAPDAPKMAPKLLQKLAEEPDELISVWLFFTDKGIADPADYQRACQAWEEKLSPRTQKRRAKMAPQNTGETFRDLPVHPVYVDAVAARVVKVRTLSRWFNGVSVQATPEQIAEVEKLPFVRALARVAHFRRDDPEAILKEPSRKARKSTGTAHRLDYGNALPQLAMMHVPELHDAGWDGTGIRIALLDAGFGPLDHHEVFQGIKIVGQWDFVEGDADVEVGANVGGHSHGTQVLSVIGGYAAGNLIGPAYGAEYLLARTEDGASETPQEEDYWIAGVEWADSLGADIVSTSLGYNIWDAGTGQNYTYEDLDGDTARITQAADWAVGRGIVVIVSVGNEGDKFWHYALFPADGDSVIAVGALNPDGSPAPFSSRGPTSDGRIKPDVSAPGVDISMVGSAPGLYSVSRGTSYSAPLAAGVAALLLQAHPAWTPMQVREALRRSGDHALHPDNEVGWGLIDAQAAMDAEHTLYGRVLDADSGLPLSMATVALLSDDFEDSTTTGASGRFLFEAIPDGRYMISARAPRYVSAQTEGVGIPDDLAAHEMNLHESIEVGDLVYNYPNPFGPLGTCLSFPKQKAEEVSVRIFAASGELIWEKPHHREENSRWNILWDGRNRAGKTVGSGTYFYLIEGKGLAVQGKMSLVR